MRRDDLAAISGERREQRQMALLIPAATDSEEHGASWLPSFEQRDVDESVPSRRLRFVISARRPCAGAISTRSNALAEGPGGRVHHWPAGKSTAEQQIRAKPIIGRRQPALLLRTSTVERDNYLRSVELLN
jgi:hypothetical protein